MEDKTMANLKLIQVDERPVKINSLRELTEEDKATLQICMQLILQYRDETDMVGLQMDIAYIVSESDLILQYQALCVVENEEWLSFMAGGPDEDTIKTYSGEMFDMVLGYARSSIAKNTVGTALAELYLPVFNREQYTKTVNIVKVD